MAVIAVGSRPETPDVTKFVLIMPGVWWRLEKSADSRVAGGIQFLPAPPSDAESTVSPILMYLLYPSLPVGFSFGLPVLPPFISHYETQLLGIRPEQRLPRDPDPLVPLSLAAAVLLHTVFGMSQANVPRVNVMTLRNGDDTIILEVTGSPPVIKRSLMIILGLSLGGCESEGPGANVRDDDKLTRERGESIRLPVVYERAVKQTPSCLGSL
ncbi:hypothetical protein X777_04512, partial [Ooceraea biroi]